MGKGLRQTVDKLLARQHPRNGPVLNRAEMTDAVKSARREFQADRRTQRAERRATETR